LVNADPGAALKLGAGPNPVRLGYFLDGYLFVKEFPAAGDSRYADRGAVGQIFLERDFCELESLGALTTLAPGSQATHRETWTLAECDSLETAKQRLVAI
jgi:hypothetical protein